jgi:probable rRNA maturation factor
MEIQIKTEKKAKGLKHRKISLLMKKALKDLGCNEGELSILITGDERIQELNSWYLKRDKPTNVLAFPMTENNSPEPESGMLGDIVVSIDTAGREAADMGISLHDRVFQLLIHGLLHLVGYDHEVSKAEEIKMQDEERRLFSLLREE